MKLSWNQRVDFTCKPMCPFVCPDFCQQHTARVLGCQAWVLRGPQTFSCPLVVTFQWRRKHCLCRRGYPESIPRPGMTWSWNALCGSLETVHWDDPTMSVCLSVWRMMTVGGEDFIWTIHISQWKRRRKGSSKICRDPAKETGSFIH